MVSESLSLLAVAPSLALMAYFYARDRYEPEPLVWIVRVMLAGVVAALPAVALEVGACRAAGLDIPPETMTGLQRAAWSFLAVAMVEEVLKLAAVLVVVYRDPEFDEPYDGIVYCVAASLGFAALENLKLVALYGVGPGVVRALLTVPAHALFGVAMGFFVGAARFAPTRGRAAALVLAGLAGAVALHGAFDWLLLAPGPSTPLLLVPFMAVGWLAALAGIRRRLWESPFRPRTTSQPEPPPEAG